MTEQGGKVKVSEWRLDFTELVMGSHCGCLNRTVVMMGCFDLSCCKLYVLCCAKSLNCVQLFVTLWTVSCQAPQSMGFPRQEYWNGLPFPSPGDLPDPGIKLKSLTFPVLIGGFLTTSAT